MVRGCRALESIIPGPEIGIDKYEWFSRGLKHMNSTPSKSVKGIPQDGSLFSRSYEWRLNMETGTVHERNLTGTEYSMDFPIINPDFTGFRNRFGYTQVVDSVASSNAGNQIYFKKLIPEISGSDEVTDNF